MTVLLCVPFVWGVELHEVTYEIEKQIAKTEHFLKIVNDSQVTLLVPEDAYNFDVLIDGHPASFDLERTDTYKLVNIDLTPTAHAVEITYLSTAFLEEGIHDYFVGNVIVLQQTKHLVARLILPEGALLARPIDALSPPVSPKPAKVETTGRQISITWEVGDVQPEEQLSLFVVYERAQSFWVYVIAGIIGVLIITGVVWKLQQKRKPALHMGQRFTHLLDAEQKIVDVLFKVKQNIMWQKELQIATGFTKSRLSRTVRNMEQRGLVKKIPYGTSNKIQLLVDKKESKAELEKESQQTPENHA